MDFNVCTVEYGIIERKCYIKEQPEETETEGEA